MELGKLTDLEGGHIIYFTIDENSPGSPWRERTRTYYVVSRSLSYIDSFYFVCRSLCGSSIEERKLKQWHTLYERLFGEISYSVFLNNVKLSPKWNFTTGSVEPVSTESGDTFGGLYRDETSARLGLQAISNHNNSSVQRRKKLQKVRRESSSTPPKTSGESKHIPSLMMNRQLNFADSTTNSIRDSACVNLSSIKATSVPAGSVEVNGKDWEDMYRKLQLTEEEELRGVTGHIRREVLPEKGVKRNSDIIALPENDSLPSRDLNVLNNGMITTGRYTSTNSSLPLPPNSVPLRTLPPQPPSAVPHVEEVKVGSCQHNALVEKIESLTEQLREKDALISNLTAEHRKERSNYRKKIRELEKKMLEYRRTHGEKLYNLVEENKSIVAKLEEDMAKKEDELRKTYEVSQQSRDIRIAQLTEQLLRSQETIKNLTGSAKEAETLKEHIKEWEKCHKEAKERFDSLARSEQNLRGEVEKTHSIVAQQQKDLREARQLIENLKQGLETVPSRNPKLVARGKYATDRCLTVERMIQCL